MNTKNLSNFLIPIALLLYIATVTSLFGYSDTLSVLTSAFIISAIITKAYEYATKKSNSQTDKIGNISLIIFAIILVGFFIYGKIAAFLIGRAVNKVWY